MVCLLCCKIWYSMLQNLNVFHRNITSYWKDFHFSESKKKTKKRKTEKHRNQNKEFITKLFSWKYLRFCLLVSVISSYCLYVTVSPGVLTLATIDTCVSSFSDNIFSSFTNKATIISTVLSVTSSLIPKCFHLSSFSSLSVNYFFVIVLFLPTFFVNESPTFSESW